MLPGVSNFRLAAKVLRFACESALVCLAAHAQPLRSPWGTVTVDAKASAFACPAALPLPKVLVFNGYYIDAHHSVIDPRAKAVYEADSRANELFLKRIGQAADGYQVNHSESAAACAFSLLQTAAQEQAFSVAHLGTNGARDGFYVQGFYLDGLALAYLKVRPSSAGSSQQRAEIQVWLLSIALSVEGFYDDMAREDAGDGHNNLTYWGALGVSATGIVTERGDLFDWGIGVYRRATKQIASDGTLPLEMDRAARALHYHLFAVAPLVMIAELGERNGLLLYEEDNGALQRLVKRTINGLVDPAYFAEKTNIAQEMPSELDGAVIGWAVPYEVRYPDPVLASLLAKASSTSNWQLGGNPPE
jgi:poly(beta-D-mannuronate) lyase